jgi:hypothetical protein
MERIGWGTCENFLKKCSWLRPTFSDYFTEAIGQEFGVDKPGGMYCADVGQARILSGVGGINQSSLLL